MKLAITASALACLVAWPIAAGAQPTGVNLINNPQFSENPVDYSTWSSGGYGNYYPSGFIVPDGWTGVESVNVNYFSANSASYPKVPVASYAAVCGTTQTPAGYLYQNISYQNNEVTLEAGYTYTLTVDFGNRSDYGGVGLIEINAVNGSTVTTLASADVSAGAGAFETWKVPYIATAGNLYLGQTLQVWLGAASSPSQNQADFENVRFSAATTPEPFTLALCAGGLGLAMARRRKSK